MRAKTVKVSIDGGPSIDVSWTADMSGEDALKAAYDLFQTQAPNTFTYSVTYYGKSLGYLVSMINGTYDSFNSKMAPFFYWELYYINASNQNTSPAQVGVDNLTLNVGDELLFKFETYNAVTHSQSTLKAKNDAQIRS